MPLKTPQNTSPYWDDYAPEKDYYKMLFQPGVSVQVREVNQLQTMLLAQVERFGDSIYKRGTIVDGCNFQFISPYPYVKLEDEETDGTPVVPSRYVGQFITDSSNLQSMVIDYADGFQSQDPDLATLYLSYRNSGSDGNTSQYSAGELLTIYDPNTSIHKVTINNAGVGFSNTDRVVFVPALVVNVSTGTFSNGDYVSQSTTIANLQIYTIDDTTLANSGQVILYVKPQNADLSNSSSNSSWWALANTDTIRNSTNTAVGTVEWVYGEAANASIITDGAGRVTSVVMEEQGAGYTYLPSVRIRSPNNSTGLTSLVLTPQNYQAQIKVANVQDAVGNGYAFGISEGYIYQRGLFLRVEQQLSIVSKYDQVPNNVVVGFQSQETIVDHRVDPTLLDNATGTPNENAPGAHRLKVVPQLTVIDLSESEILPEDDFFTICQWSEGNPYKQNPGSVYSKIGDEMARRTSEQSGDFVLDKFQVTTRSVANTSLEGSKVSVIVDPGTAYIEGYRVQTVRNDVIDIRKGTDTLVSNSQLASLAYGNWVRLKELGGVFQFSTGDQITLYDAPKSFLSNASLVLSGNTTPVGNNIGTARIRSLTHLTGTPGEPNCAYRGYLFSITMAQGKNFSQVRSLSYTAGTYPGIADIVVELDPISSTNVALLHDTQLGSLIVPALVDTLKNANQVSYTYRTIDQTLAVSNAGTLVKSLTGSPGEFFAAEAGSLSSSEMQDILVIPVGNSLIASANLAGTVVANTTMPNCVGTGTSFVTDTRAGDYVYIYTNSTMSDTRRVVTVVNNTLLVLDSNGTATQSGAAIYRTFPKHAPVPFGTRDGLSSSVDANGNVLTVNFGMAFQGSVTVNAAMAVDIDRVNASPGTKTASRNRFVMLRMANNAGNTAGPWALGIPDAFRLTGVWKDTSSSVNTSSTDVTSEFYIDHNQNENYVDISWLAKKPTSGLALTSSDYLLVEFDHFSIGSSGYYDTVSYLSSNTTQILATDSLTLENLGANTSSWEIPEVYTAKGKYYDLLNCFDFRPAAVNTVASSSNQASCPLNPGFTLSFGNTADPANDKKFPHPESSIAFNQEQWIGRCDSVYVSRDNSTFVLRGTPSASRASYRSPNQPSGTLKLNDVFIPPYPTMSQNPSEQMLRILDTKVGNERIRGARLRDRTIRTLLSPRDIEDSQPRGFSMKDIGSLQRRIQNLEYYASLSLLETDVKDRIIPSSVDGTLNRFKYGFQADDFSTNILQDTLNPQYTAAIIQDKLLPNTVTWTVGHGTGDTTHHCPYIDFLVVSQDYATLPNTVNATCNSSTQNTSGVGLALVKAGDGSGGSISGHITTYFIQLPPTTKTSANGVLYFYAGLAPLKFSISGVDVPASVVTGPDGANGYTFAKANTAIPLTAADKTMLFQDGWVSPTRIANAGSSTTGYTDPVFPGGAYADYVSGFGKIAFTLNPTISPTGTYALNVSRSITWDQEWRILVAWPIAASVPACTTQAPQASPGSFTGTSSTTPGGFPAGTTVYGAGFGVVRAGLTNTVPIGFSVMGLDVGNAQRSISAEEKIFNIALSGLKPNTRHYPTMYGQTVGSICRPVGGNIGDPLVTDAQGKLIVDFYYIFTPTSANSVPVSNLSDAAEQAAFQNKGKVVVDFYAIGSQVSVTLNIIADTIVLGKVGKLANTGG